MKLTMSAISEYSFEELYEIMAKNKLEMTLQVKVGDHYNSNLSWAYAYLWALFIGESIVKYCEFITADNEGDYINFTFKSKDLVKLINNLKWFTLSYEENPTEYLKLENIYDNFKDSLEKRNLYFPEIADSYLGNIMLGMRDFGDEVIKKIYTEHPELKHYFFRSYASNNIGYDFYVSESSWIVPVDQNVQELLKLYGGMKDKLHNFEEAFFLSVINSQPIIFNETNLIRFPQSEIHEVQKCAEDIWQEKFTLDILDKEGTIITDFQDSRIQEIYKARRRSNYKLDISDIQKQIKKILLSRDGDILILYDSVCQYVFFSDSIETVNYEYLEIYLNKLNKIYTTLIGKPSEIACPWEKLNDEEFEQLCYDVISSYYQPGMKIRKMGKSRSRDGGRDIEFHTPGRLGKPSVKWMAQCKLIRNGSSLTASKVKDITTDIFFHYQAKGFCIMTSGIIDSTLYDRLDAIKKETGIEIDDWCKLKIERFLANHPVIRNRYFQK